jgi:acyl transferase domain-containing protein
VVNDQSQRKELLIFSAGHPESVKSMVKKYQNYLAKFPDRLRKIAYNLSERRERLKYRAFCLSNGSQLLSETAAAPCRNLNQIAFVFTGQGAQWYVFLYSLFPTLSSRVIAKECRVHMGRDLMLEFPSFLENIRSMDRVLKTLEHAPSWSIEGKLTHIKPLTKSEPY